MIIHENDTVGVDGKFIVSIHDHTNPTSNPLEPDYFSITYKNKENAWITRFPLNKLEELKNLLNK